MEVAYLEHSQWKGWEVVFGEYVFNVELPRSIRMDELTS